jgi:hypothetical protein
MWPPRIIAKDSALSKKDAPGTAVTVSLPALIRSGVLLAGERVGPDAEQPVLGVQQHAREALGVIGQERRHADAEVDVQALAQLERGAGDDALTGAPLLGRATLAQGLASRTRRRSIGFS